jgi:hypothetical protein
MFALDVTEWLACFLMALHVSNETCSLCDSPVYKNVTAGVVCRAAAVVSTPA